MSRRLQLEEMLISEPNDPFLNYAYALELVKVGEREQGLARLADMNLRMPNHVPAFFRRGQLLAEDGEDAAAKEVLRLGIAAARQIGDDHAVAEMSELLASL